MNVLVTGASTPLGRALATALLADRRVDVVLAVGEQRRDERPDERARRAGDEDLHR